MPIYTYKCKKCEKEFEKFKSMDSNGTESCDECGSETLRVFSPAGIIFKGSGFYTTDYKTGSNKANLNTAAGNQENKDNKKQPDSNDSGGKSKVPEVSSTPPGTPVKSSDASGKTKS